MTITAIAKQVTAEKSATQVRFRTGGKGEVKEYDCKPLFTGRNKGWVLLDLTTAGAIMAVYNALSESKRPSMDTIPLTKLVDFCWRMVAK